MEHDFCVCFFPFHFWLWTVLTIVSQAVEYLWRRRKMVILIWDREKGQQRYSYCWIVCSMIDGRGISRHCRLPMDCTNREHN